MRRLVVGLLRLAAIIGGGGLAVAFTLAAIAPRLGDIFTANESASAEINLNELALRSIVYDMHGDEFDVLYDVENRELVDLDDISHAMIMSLLVVEDEGFYDHNGVDAKAIGRAFIENVNAGGIEQGDAEVERLVDDGAGFFGAHASTEIVAAEANERDLQIRVSQLPVLHDASPLNRARLDHVVVGGAHG